MNEEEKAQLKAEIKKEVIAEIISTLQNYNTGDLGEALDYFIEKSIRNPGTPLASKFQELDSKYDFIERVLTNRA